MAAVVGEFEGLLFAELLSQAGLPIPQAQLFRLLVVADAFGFFLFFFAAVLFLGHIVAWIGVEIKVDANLKTLRH